MPHAEVTASDWIEMAAEERQLADAPGCTDERRELSRRDEQPNLGNRGYLSGQMHPTTSILVTSGAKQQTMGEGPDVDPASLGHSTSGTEPALGSVSS